MKFSSKERKLTSNQKTMAIELGLADQKKAIELLYSQYGTPIQTCVQELVSNAFDAHKAANREHIPVKIQAPNELNDFYFSVRDYGDSMDDDTIKNVYMRVNASTKSGNNNAIGGFGIGSKTPWAYTDTFILKTFLNGLETQYGLVKGRSSVSVVYQGETDQENGTEVIFKTKERDKSYFENAIRRISLCAKVKPEVNISKSLDFNQRVDISPTVSLVESDILSDDLYLNLGGVLYGVNNGFIYNSDSPWRHSYMYDRITNLVSYDAAVVINLPVGAIMPLQTREGLFTGGEEGQQNKSVLKKVLKLAYETLDSYVKEQRSAVKTPQQAVSFFGNGLINSSDTFKFDGFYINKSGIGFEKSGSISELSRKKSRGWRGEKTVRAKNTRTGFLYFKDANSLPVYFTDLSPNKARLVSRFHEVCRTTDVIVIEKSQFENASKVYEFLKDFTNAQDVTEVDIPKVESANKGVKKNKNKVVWYDSRGTRMGSFIIGESTPRPNPTVLVSKDGYCKYFHIYEALNYNIWYVADSNIKKLKEEVGFFTQDEVIKREHHRIIQLIVNYRVNRKIDKFKRTNGDYVMGLANPNKASLYEKVGKGVDVECYYPLYESIMKTHGKAIDRAVKKTLKNLHRAATLIDKAPLAQHIKYISSLDKRAKADLDKYIVERIGKWYGTHHHV